MIARLFHAWERRLASVTTDRVVRAFEWGSDWVPAPPPASTHADSPDAGGPVVHDAAEARRAVNAWASAALTNSEGFFEVPATDEFELAGDELCFPSALATPHPENNVVYARYHRATSAPDAKRAVVVLPQWNADPDGHMALSRLLASSGVSALRLSLPYHDRRMPPELHRADYIVSANIGRTLQVCRQAVLDARRAVQWLRTRGYERIGILGTSLGSCLAMLAAAHDRAIRVAALNHISPFFADVVWEGLSTAHVRAGLNGAIDLDELRRLWMPISPQPYIDRMHGKRVLLVYARYDLSFPVRLSQQLVEEFERRRILHRVVVLPCGHYSTGVAPFSWIDGFALVRFLRREL